MDKKILEVPANVRYISDWTEYNLGDYDFPHIINKVLTGCGFTEYCLRNYQDLILVSPRRFLLENKEEQHTSNEFYVKNELESFIDYEFNMDSKSKKKTFKKIDENNNEVKSRIIQLKKEIVEYCIRCRATNKPIKLLVTYDSFRHVKEALLEHKMFFFQNFQIVVDEFQSIFIDSRFKSDTEIELLYHLRDIQRLCFVSATPMLDKYLDMLDDFKDLPYLEFDWVSQNPGRVRRPILDVKFTNRGLNEEAGRVVQNYLKGNFESMPDPDTGGLLESQEATIFMNSVANICQVIRSNMLHTDQCNVLCARTEENRTVVRKAFNDVLRKEHEDEPKIPKVPRDYDVIGRIPGKGEKHKMFTFCTRTVYLGADFYSTNSRTFIFSDSNIDCLSVDISMDLEQILGRQRLDCNPWKNSAKLFVRTTVDGNIVSKEEYENYINEKIVKTKALLEVYDDAKQANKFALAEKYEKDANASKYKDDYVSVNRHAGSNLVPVFNNLVHISEIRSYEVQQIDYKDRFSVFSALNEKRVDSSLSEKLNDEVTYFNKQKTSIDKFKFIVDLSERSDITEQMMLSFLEMIPVKYKEYYILLGPDRIKANSYQESKLKQEWININTPQKEDEQMINEIYNLFEIGKRYIKADIKNTFKQLYTKYNYQKTAKAIDIEDYFNVKSILTPDKKHGFEILSKK